jgi:prepilin-type N-terminal cleavage/methylation domain-containing protein
MKKPACFKSRSGFTRLELLVVISIISALTALSFIAAQTALQAARNMNARAQVVAVQNGLQNYLSEHGRLPSRTSRADEEVTTATGSEVLAALLGQPVPGLPTRHIAFFASNLANNGKNGLVADGHHYGLVDPWGEPLVILMDTDYDEWLSNPDLANSKHADTAPARIPTRILVYSKGSDQKAQTADDIVSWRK